MSRYINSSLITLLLSALCASPVYATTTYTQFSRYLSVTNAPLEQHDDGLNSIIQRAFPAAVKTIGEAVKDTLKGSGYQLLAASQSSVHVRQLYAHPLPIYWRVLGPMSLKQALLQLAGQSYQLVIDPVHRLVTYKLRHDYKTL